MDSIYCENCVYVGSTGGTRNQPVDNCKAPIDNWLSPTAPCDVACSIKNRNNDCEDFKERDTS